MHDAPIFKSSHLDGVDHLTTGAEHALPDPGQIPQVEDIVEFRRCWKHFHLGQLPEVSGQRHQVRHDALHLLCETTACAEVALTNHTCMIRSVAAGVIYYVADKKGQ